MKNVKPKIGYIEIILIVFIVVLSLIIIYFK